MIIGSYLNFPLWERGIRGGFILNLISLRLLGGDSLSDFTREIFHHQPDGFIIRLSKDGLASLLTVDETGVPEFLEVMGNRGKRHIEIVGDGANRRSFFLVQVCLALAGTDAIKNGEACFIGQCLECG